MTVIIINEENHGLIGIAIDHEAARRYVIEKWLKDSSDVVIGENETEYVAVNVVEHFGENWREKLYEMTFEEFENLLDDWFYFYGETIIEQ